MICNAIIMSNWSELPQELLQTITQKQSNYVDYISTRAVCKSWWSAIPKKPHDLLCQLPWLLLPYHKNNPNHRGFYNLADGKTYHLELPETIEKRCCGSSHGWLVMVEDTPSIFLLNPLTKARIELPSLSTFPNFPTEVVYENSRNINEYFNTKAKLRIRETYIRKAIVSEDPSTGNFAVMTIYKTINSTENIAFCKSGDATWFTIQETSQKIHYQDVMFHRGKFYAVDDKSRVSICITDINPPSVIQVADPPPVPPLMGYKQWYLASLDEDLILAGRFRKYRGSGYEYQTHKFMVYKLDASSSNWLELDGLGDMLSFLGWNCFHSISTQNYRNYSGNCIYFTDDKFIVGSDFPWEGHDYGIFNLDDKSVQRLGLPSYPIKLPILPFIYGYERSLKRDRSSFILPPPIWVTINP